MATDTLPNVNKPSSPPRLGTVQDLYELLRIARMNVVYYGWRLWQLQALALTVDVLVVISTSSAVASLAFWSEAHAKAVPLAFGAVATILSVVRPSIGLPRRVQRVGSQWSGYIGVFHAAERIARDVRAEHAMTPEQRTLLGGLHDRMNVLEQSDEPWPNEARLMAAKRQVDGEFPVDDWWTPDDA